MIKPMFATNAIILHKEMQFVDYTLLGDKRFWCGRGWGKNKVSLLIPLINFVKRGLLFLHKKWRTWQVAKPDSFDWSNWTSWWTSSAPAKPNSKTSSGAWNAGLTSLILLLRPSLMAVVDTKCFFLNRWAPSWSWVSLKKALFQNLSYSFRIDPDKTHECIL